MHKSKLGGFIIDCRTDDLAGATALWSRALGMPLREVRRRVRGAAFGVDLMLRVCHKSATYLT